MLNLEDDRNKWSLDRMQYIKSSQHNKSWANLYHSEAENFYILHQTVSRIQIKGLKMNCRKPKYHVYMNKIIQNCQPTEVYIPNLIITQSWVNIMLDELSLHPTILPSPNINLTQIHDEIKVSSKNWVVRVPMIVPYKH